MAFVKQVAVTCGLALAAAAAPVILAAPAQAKNCPPGTTKTKFDGVCVAGGLGGNAVVTAPTAGGPPELTSNPGQLPSVRGIPCTPENYGTCYGLLQQP